MDMSYAFKEIGNKVRKYRKAKSYSTSDLASKLGVSVGLVNNLENARNDVFRLKLLHELSAELGVPIPELLDYPIISSCATQISENEINIKIPLHIHKLDVHKGLLQEQITALLNAYISTILHVNLSQDSIIKLTNTIQNMLDLIKTKE